VIHLEQDTVEHKMRHAAAIIPSLKFGKIVAGENQADADKVKLPRWIGHL